MSDHDADRTTVTQTLQTIVGERRDDEWLAEQVPISRDFARQCLVQVVGLQVELNACERLLEDLGIDVEGEQP